MRRTLLQIATCLLLLCWCARSAPAQSVEVISARAGLVISVEGEVLYRKHDEQETRPLQTNVKLGDGDTVLTTAKARTVWSLTPGSYLQVGADSYVRVYETSLDNMHFDVERGEVVVIVRSLRGGASLVLHTPPGLLTVYKPGRYRFRVAENGETEAAVVKGELRYVDKGKIVSLKKRMKVNFYRVEKKKNGHGA